jgi:hypothetical protein
VRVPKTPSVCVRHQRRKFSGGEFSGVASEAQADAVKVSKQQAAAAAKAA